MGNNVGIAIFIFQALLALFAFFVTAPMTLNAISLFGVQKRFAEEMIKLGVVKEKDVKNMQTKADSRRFDIACGHRRAVLLVLSHGADGISVRRRAAHGRLLEIPQHP